MKSLKLASLSKMAPSARADEISGILEAATVRAARREFEFAPGTILLREGEREHPSCKYSVNP